jgi:thiamine kinase-like enzyme
MADSVSSGAGLTGPPEWALRRVPGLDDGQPPRLLQRLGGGSVNEVFRVDSTEGAFVVRLDGATWRRPGVDRLRELALHRVAAAAGVAPQIVAAAPGQDGLLITQYLPGRIWKSSDYSDLRSLRRLGERLALLHQQTAPPFSPFDPVGVARDYVNRIAPALVAPVAPVMRQLVRLCDDLDSVARASVVHGDLWESNLLDGTGLWLLDWEYAQVTEPLMEIAGLLAYYPAAQRYQTELMAAAGMTSSTQAALADRIHIYRILSWLWRLARGERAEPPGQL